MKYYPIFLDIAGKKCVVVGGGDVAARKVKRLSDCGAKVFVVSPELTPELATLKAGNGIEHIATHYDIQHLAGAVLIIGATDNDKINEAISNDARNLGIPVNIVDDPQKCDFILPSVVERGDLTMACSTGGNSPALARRLREELESAYGEEYGTLLKLLGQLREKMEKNAGVGNTWFDQLMGAGLLEAIRRKDDNQVKEIIHKVTGKEVHID